MSVPPPPGFDRAESFDRYLAALLQGDRVCCQACYEEWLATTPDLRTIYEDLVRRALYAVGDLWQQGKISVATEHLATAISDGLLHLSYPRLFAVPRCGRSAVVAATAGERHQLGVKMVADMFEWHGWRTWYLGADMPLPDMLDLVGQAAPDAVALSLTLSANLPALLHTVAAVRTRFPELPVLVGGQAFSGGGRERVESLAGVRCLTSLADLETWLSSGHGNRP